jgi:hypothetical protein
MHQIKACASCGEAIVFLPTSTGKWMPVDTASISPEDTTYEPRSGHVSHWEMCAEPRPFRRQASA